MKFNIFNYSQPGAISLKLDLKDLLILDWFQTFIPRMHKIIYENEQYYWISYEKVLQDIPILEIKTEKGLYKRLQNLCEIGILKHHTKRSNGGCYSYYFITDMIKILISPESSFANTPKVPLQSPESSQQKDSSVINSSVINSSLAEVPKTQKETQITISSNPNTEIAEIIESCTDDDLQAINQWLDYKKDKKQPYKEKSIPVVIKKLQSLAKESNATMREIVENSIASNYAGLFPIKKQSINQKNYDTNKKLPGLNIAENSIVGQFYASGGNEPSEASRELEEELRKLGIR